MNKLATLRDVARLAGVSHITVSRVVRGEPKVKESTAQRVRAAIAQVDYRPQPHLSALAAYRTRANDRSHGSTIAFLDCDGSAYSSKVLEGARKESSAFGYGFEYFKLYASTPAEVQRLGRILFHRGVEGLLFGPADSSLHLNGWKWEGFAAVSLGVLPHEPAINAVAMDYFQGLQLALASLSTRGFHRIGLILSRKLEARTSHQWLGAYLATSECNIPPLLFEEEIPDRDFLLRWTEKHRIDAVLTIQEIGRILQEMGVRAFYLNPTEAPSDAEYISLPPENIGREGTRLLHQALLRRELGLPEYPETVLLRGHLASLTGNREDDSCAD